MLLLWNDSLLFVIKPVPCFILFRDSNGCELWYPVQLWCRIPTSCFKVSCTLYQEWRYQSFLAIGLLSIYISKCACWCLGTTKCAWNRNSEAYSVPCDLVLAVIADFIYLSQPLLDSISACVQHFKHVRYEPTFGQILFTTYAKLEGSIITLSRFSMTSLWR